MPLYTQLSGTFRNYHTAYNMSSCAVKVVDLTMGEVASRKRGRPLGSTKKRKVKDKKGRFVKEAPARVETEDLCIVDDDMHG